MAIDPARKAAIAVMVLGKDLARNVFKLLEPEDIERLLRKAESLKDVTAEEVMHVLEELTGDVERQVRGVAGHERMLHEAAEQALGRDNVTSILGRESRGATAQLQRAAASDPGAFAQAIGREHPQVVAVVMAILEPGVASRVLTALPSGLRGEVVRRVANLRTVPAQVISEVAEIVGRDLRPPDAAGPVNIDGTKTAVDMLKTVGRADEEVIFEDLEQRDAELAEELRSLMFVFEDLLRLHPREVQLVLREVDGQQLALALKSASEELRGFLLSNMSSRAALIVVDDMEALGPVSRAQVEEAQREMVATVMRLADEGRVNIRPGDTV